MKSLMSSRVSMRWIPVALALIIHLLLFFVLFALWVVKRTPQRVPEPSSNTVRSLARPVPAPVRLAPLPTKRKARQPLITTDSGAPDEPQQDTHTISASSEEGVIPPPVPVDAPVDRAVSSERVYTKPSERPRRVRAVPPAASPTPHQPRDDFSSSGNLPSPRRHQHAWYRNTAYRNALKKGAQQKDEQQKPVQPLKRYAAQLAAADYAPAQSASSKALALSAKLNQGFVDERMRRYGRLMAEKIVAIVNRARISCSQKACLLPFIIGIARDGTVVSVDLAEAYSDPMIADIAYRLKSIIQTIRFDSLPSSFSGDMLSWQCRFRLSECPRPGIPMQLCIIDDGF